MPEYLAPGVYVEEVPSAVRPIAGVGTSTAGFIGISGDIVEADMPEKPAGGHYKQADALIPQPVNNWEEFKQKFGDFKAANEYLAHAVYGFFNNGGTSCFVVRVVDATTLSNGVQKALEQFEAIDEIAIVAAPLPPTDQVSLTQAVLNDIHGKLVAHCANMQDRVAILDSARDITNDNLQLTTDDTGIWRPAANPKGYAAFYFPWIKVADPIRPAGSPPVAVPPSGHLAGIYARSDAERGVHKAPANEVVLGALGVRYPVSKSLQDQLNPKGVNCIRSFNGTIKVWGARTLASDPSGDPEWRYVNIRRLVNYLRESIDEGTQWVVFEPNEASLWAKFTRNVTAFLTNVWRAGALFGATPQEAFYVRCDATTNPPEVRDLGRVVTEIGIAPVKPAEFVIFRISQWAGPAA